MVRVAAIILLLGVTGCRARGGAADADGSTLDPQPRDTLFFQYCDRTGAVREALRGTEKFLKWYYIRGGQPNDGRGPWRTVTADELATMGIDLKALGR